MAKITSIPKYNFHSENKASYTVLQLYRIVFPKQISIFNDIGDGPISMFFHIPDKVGSYDHYKWSYGAPINGRK